MKVNSFWNLIFLVAVTLSSAQNARINALGGNFCVDDISSVLQNPAAGVYYKDVVQGTAYQDGTFGPVIGIKSIVKRLSVGFAANIPDDLQSTFYNDAKEFLDSTIDTQTVIPDRFPPYPHLIAALNLSFLTIGGEVFYKKTAHESSFNENGIVHSVSKEVTNTGINVNTSIMLGKIGIYPFAMYAVPTMTGSVTSSEIDSNVAVSTTANRAVKCGLELGFSPGRFIFTVGGVLFDECYTFQSIGNQKGAISSNFSTAIDLYGGVTTYPTDDIMLSVVYDYSRGSFTCNSEIKNQSDKHSEHEEWIENFHFAVASCEITHDIPSIGMNVVFRAGVSWLAGTTDWKSEYHEDSYQYDEQSKSPAIVTQVVPTAGIGFERGVLMFDIASKLAGWSGIASGMPVVTGTLTFDFSKQESRKELK